MNLDQFIATNNGRWIDFDGVYGAQCVDEYDFYLRDVWAVPIYYVEGAIDLFGGRSDLIDWTANDWGNVAQFPQRGDAIIWGPNAKVGTGVYGHVGIVTRADGYTFDSFDQNWPVGAACHIVHHTYDGVRGWGRRKVAVVMPPPPPPPPPPALYTVMAADGAQLGMHLDLDVAKLAASKYASEHREVEAHVLDKDGVVVWSISVPAYYLFSFRPNPPTDLHPPDQATHLDDAKSQASSFASEHPGSSIDVVRLLPAPTGDDRGATEEVVFHIPAGVVPAA